MIRLSSIVFVALVALTAGGCSDRTDGLPIVMQETPTPGHPIATQQDEGITRQIEAAIASHDFLSEQARGVEVVTQDGVVTLEGSVASDPERTTLEAIARGIQGVKRVESELVVGPSSAGV
jgi:hyperosmotically inducible protein